MLRATGIAGALATFGTVSSVGLVAAAGGAALGGLIHTPLGAVLAFVAVNALAVATAAASRTAR